MVAHFNELRKLGDEQVTEVLLFLKKIYDLEYEPNDAKAYKEEWYDTSTYSIDGYIKHTVWPVPVLSMH